MAVQSAHEAFDLGMGDWTDEPEETSVQPPPPKKRLRLSLGKEAPLRETSNRRFAGPVSTGELENAAKGVVPANTAASTQWAVKNFESWARSRPSSSTDAVPSDLLMSHDADLVSKMPFRARNTKNGRDTLPSRNSPLASKWSKQRIAEE